MKKQSLDPRAQRMLHLMLKVGIGVEAAVRVLGAIGIDPTLLTYFSAPIGRGHDLVDPLPDWLRTAVYLDRLDQIWAEQAAGAAGPLATVSDVLAYLYPVSPADPLSAADRAVYAWCVRDVCSRYGRTSAETGFKVTAAESVGDLSADQRREVLAAWQSRIRQRIVAGDEVPPIRDDRR